MVYAQPVDLQESWLANEIAGGFGSLARLRTSFHFIDQHGREDTSETDAEGCARGATD